MKWWGWALAGGALLWLTKLVAKPGPVAPAPEPWVPGEEIETELGQKVEIEEGGGHVSTGDYINLDPFQIYWSDAFLQEVWSRANSYAGRVGAYDTRIYKEVQGSLRIVGKLTRTGEYFPVGAKYPLDIAGLAYEEQRAPYWN